MKLTRDSAAWTIGLVVSVLGYLALLPPPRQWTYHDWIVNAIVALGMISAKLGNSMLKGRDDSMKDAAQR